MNQEQNKMRMGDKKQSYLGQNLMTFQVVCINHMHQMSMINKLRLNIPCILALTRYKNKYKMK